jgi:hypothetical protein
MWSDPNFVNNVILAIIAISNAVTAYLAFKNHNAIQAVNSNISTIEKATNSMKDALVKTTGELGMAKGYEAGRLAGQATSDHQAALDRTSEAEDRDRKS